MPKEIKSPTVGIVGYLEEVEIEHKDSILVFQLPRPTNMLSETYLKQATDTIKRALPEGRQAIVIGGDINIYELTGADASILRLKGILL